MSKVRDMEWLVQKLKEGKRDLYPLIACIIFNKELEDISDFERTLAKLRCLDIMTRPATPFEKSLTEAFIGTRMVKEEKK